MAAPRPLEHWLELVNRLGLRQHASRALREVVEGKPAAPRTAKKPRSAKAKGARAVREVRDLLRTWFPEWGEDDLLIQTTSVGGQDLHLSPRAARDFPYAIEVKNVEALNLWKAIEQANRNAVKKRRRPIIFCRRNTTPLHVVIDAREFMEIVTVEAVFCSGGKIGQREEPQ